MSRSEDRSRTPRAVIHKRILDVAESKPDASMEEIADVIGGASTDLVERVLEEYGDPVEDTHSDTDSTAGAAPAHTMLRPDASAGDSDRTGVDRSKLARKQLDTLRLIEERPNASQGDLAETFDVTRATISRWLNDIPGFRWDERREIAAEILNGGEGAGSTAGEKTAKSTADETTGEFRQTEAEPLAELRERLDAIERRIEDLDGGPSATAIDPDLAHRVVHACMKSDRITEQEELTLLRELMG